MPRNIVHTLKQVCGMVHRLITAHYQKCRVKSPEMGFLKRNVALVREFVPELRFYLPIITPRRLICYQGLVCPRDTAERVGHNWYSSYTYNTTITSFCYTLYEKNIKLTDNNSVSMSFLRFYYVVSQTIQMLSTKLGPAVYAKTFSVD